LNLLSSVLGVLRLFGPNKSSCEAGHQLLIVGLGTLGVGRGDTQAAAAGDVEQLAKLLEEGAWKQSTGFLVTFTVRL
jgi:hypothetical protein